MRLGPGIGPGFESAVRGFAPVDLSGLVLWLRADLGITLNGSQVSAWADQSGLGHNGSQATGAQQPLLVSSGQNGQPVLRGDGARRIDISGMSAPTAATYVFVMSGMVGAGNAYLSSGNASANAAIIANFEGAGVVSWFNGSDVQNFGTLPTDRSLHVLTVAQTNGSSLAGYLDGAQVFSVTPTTALQGLGAIFNYITATSNGFDGDLAEVIAYSRVLGTGERASLTAYLKGRYAIA